MPKYDHLDSRAVGVACHLCPGYTVALMTVHTCIAVVTKNNVISIAVAIATATGNIVAIIVFVSDANAVVVTFAAIIFNVINITVAMNCCALYEVATFMRTSVWC